MKPIHARFIICACLAVLGILGLLAKFRTTAPDVRSNALRDPARTNCPDCGCAPGELHDLFCTKERCPFCGGQLVSCQCNRAILNLSEEERAALDEYVDDSVEPLKSVVERWKNALEAKGRIPW